jgi:hypothetical protein
MPLLKRQLQLTRRRKQVEGSLRRLISATAKQLSLTLLPVELLELVPLGADDDSLGILAGLLSAVADLDMGLQGLRGDRSVARSQLYLSKRTG